MREPDGVVWVSWAGVVLVSLCAALAAVLEAMLVPLYLGSWLFPITVLAAVVSNVALPRMARALVPRTSAATLPFIVWLAVMFTFLFVARPEGDVILPGGNPLQWVTYGVLLGGAVAGVASVAQSAPLPGAPLPGAALPATSGSERPDRR